jgi:hypothetical protein
MQALIFSHTGISIQVDIAPVIEHKLAAKALRLGRPEVSTLKFTE